MTAAALYVYSPCVSLTEQIRTVANRAAEQDIQITRVYADFGQSLSLDQRAGFQQMVADCKRRLLDTILIETAAVFGKNASELARYRWILCTHGVKVMSVDGKPFPDTTGDHTGLLPEVIAYYERLLVRVATEQKPVRT